MFQESRENRFPAAPDHRLKLTARRVRILSFKGI